MNKICAFAFIFNVCLSGCINFNPKGNNEEIVDYQQDEMAMRQSDHIKFKGVPIDGKLDEFVARMKRKGFKHIDSSDNMAVLQGDFADFKECIVYVSTLENKDLVSTISVEFPEQEQWKYLYGDYKHLKELLIEKYGKPSSCTEKPNNRYKIKSIDDTSMMYRVKFDECKYETRFTKSNGEIALWIEHDDSFSCFVMLAYKDKMNGNIIREHAKNDL